MNHYPMPRFDLIHGTNRPYAWQKIYAQYLRTADDPASFRYTLVCDRAMEKYFRATVPDRIPLLVNDGQPCYVAAANYGTAATSAPIILEATDDMFPPPHWDTLLWEIFNRDSTKHVAWVNDQTFPHIMTMQVMTRTWYEKYGYVFKPKFYSMLGDHDFTRRAVHDGVTIDVRDRPELHWTHYHHRNGMRPADTSDEANQSAERYAQGWTALAEDWPEYKQNPLLDILYEAARRHPGDINEHMPFLKDIAKDATILELGVRSGCSSLAFLAGRPKKLVSVDIEWRNLDPQIPAGAMIEKINWQRREQDSRLEVPSWDEFDLAFFDTIHNAGHLRAELAAHASHAQKLIFHDTTTNWERGEDGGPGLREPISELISSGDWGVAHRFENNNGLLVLERIPVGVPA